MFDINGIEDHVHLYLRSRPDIRISDLMRVVKAGSSKWVHETFPELKDFAWQSGYSVFSVSKYDEQGLKDYIANQHEHHKKERYTFELLRLLYQHNIEFDARYLFD